MSGALPDPGFIVILAGGLTAVFALNEARHHLYQRWRARHTRPPVPGNAATPPAAAPAYPDGQTPAPGHSLRVSCGAADRAWLCAEEPDHLGDHAVYVDGKAVHRWPATKTPVPGRARYSYRAPTGEDFGTCHTTIHLHDSGTAVILDHVRRRRIVCHPFPGGSDEAFLAHLEREVWDT